MELELCFAGVQILSYLFPHLNTISHVSQNAMKLGDVSVCVGVIL